MLILVWKSSFLAVVGSPSSVYLLPLGSLGVLVALEEGDQLGPADGAHQNGGPWREGTG